MKFRFAWNAVALSIGTVACSAAFASIADFTGHWKNDNNSTRGITRLVINRSGNGVNVHAWGRCHPEDCDWGVQRGVAYAPSVYANVVQYAHAVTVAFKENSKVTTLVLRARGNSLTAQAFTRFTDNGNRGAYTRTYRLVRTPGEGWIGGKEDCTTFDYNNARVQKINNRWKITVGRMWLLDFARKKAEAKQALNIIKRLHMNKQCFVGRPNPSFEYYLSDNRAPSGSVYGEDCLRFNPNDIRVRKIQNSWKIVDGNRWMFDFGSNKDEARQSSALIKKYRFRQTCYVGRSHPLMSYLKR